MGKILNKARELDSLLEDNTDKESLFLVCTDGNEVSANYVIPDIKMDDLVMAMAVVFRKNPSYELIVRSALNAMKLVKDEMIKRSEHIHVN